jgi:hypothetical protein
LSASRRSFRLGCLSGGWLGLREVRTRWGARCRQMVT